MSGEFGVVMGGGRKGKPEGRINKESKVKCNLGGHGKQGRGEWGVETRTLRPRQFLRLPLAKLAEEYTPPVQDSATSKEGQGAWLRDRCQVRCGWAADMTSPAPTFVFITSQQDEEHQCQEDSHVHNMMPWAEILQWKK